MSKPHFKMHVGWLNIYKFHNTRIHSGGLYRTREAANKVAKEWRLDCVRVYWLEVKE